MCTRDGTPYLIWIENVRAAVGCSDAALKPHRVMLARWYHAGESVEIAAPGLRLLVEMSARFPVDTVRGNG